MLEAIAIIVPENHDETTVCGLTVVEFQAWEDRTERELEKQGVRFVRREDGGFVVDHLDCLSDK